MKSLALLLTMITIILCDDPTSTTIVTDDFDKIGETTPMEGKKGKDGVDPSTTPKSSNYDAKDKVDPLTTATSSNSDAFGLVDIGEVKSRKRGDLPDYSVVKGFESIDGNEITKMKASTSWNAAFQQCCKKGRHLLVMSNITERGSIPELQDIDGEAMECDSAGEGLVHDRTWRMKVHNPSRYWLTGTNCDQIETGTVTCLADLDVLFCRSDMTEHIPGCPKRGIVMEYSGLTAVCLKHKMVTDERIEPECLPPHLKYILQQKPTERKLAKQKPTEPGPVDTSETTKEMEPERNSEEDKNYIILTPEAPKHGASKRRYKSAAASILPPEGLVPLLLFYSLFT